MGVLFWVRNALSSFGIAARLALRDGQPLPAPTDAQQVFQLPGTLWCGPAVAVTLHRLVRGTDFPIEQAKAALLGTFDGGQTSVEALAAWLADYAKSTAVISLPAKGVFESVTKAVRRGYYVVMLVWREGIASSVAHFLIAYGATETGLLVTDSIPRDGQHRYEIPHRDLEDRWCARVSRLGDRVPMILVRGA